MKQSREKKRSTRDQEIAHYLKSPLASMQAFTMILRRDLQKKQPDAFLATLDGISAKITLLNTRLELFFEYLDYKEAKKQFTYAFFPFPALLQDLAKTITQNKIVYLSKVPDVEMLGDKNRLVSSVMQLIKRLFKPSEIILLSFVSGKRTVSIEISQRMEEVSDPPRPQNNLEEDLLYYMAKNCIALHGGSILEKQNKKNLMLRLVLPLRPKVLEKAK